MTDIGVDNLMLYSYTNTLYSNLGINLDYCFENYDGSEKASAGVVYIFPNGQLNKFGEVTTLNICLCDAIPDTFLNNYITDPTLLAQAKVIFNGFKSCYSTQYWIEFTSGTTPTVLTITGANNIPDIRPNTTYLLHVIDGFVEVISRDNK